MRCIVVLFGPALPGRDLVESALQAALPAGARIVVAELPSAAERRALARGLAMTGERVAYVSWSCGPHEAEREIFHHYASMPNRYADARWTEFLTDLGERELPRGEVVPVFEVRAGEPITPAVAPVVAWAGPGAPSPKGGRRVLVVEDDPDQRVLLEDALLELGCEVVTTATAEEALALVSVERFDLVVADHGLPNASGADLARALVSVQPDIHVAIVTGQPDQAIDALGLRPVDAVLAKPIGIVDLIHLVDDLAHRAGARPAGA